jgi:hypothetical protein
MGVTSNDDETLSDVVGRVLDDAKSVARAEANLAKARAIYKIRGYKAPAILFGIAAVLALAAAIGLIVGLILTLATLVGPGFATLIVVAGFGLIAFVCVRVGIAKL